MTALPLISIVLPIHNGAKYLNRAIYSCVDQTYSHWELILVDDFSTDETPNIIAGWVRKEPRIRSIRNQENKKLPASLNIGFSQAAGLYLTWTSDDNMYRPQALSIMVKYLEDHPDVDIVYTDYTIIDANGEERRQIKVPSVQTLVDRNGIGACFMYRRSVQQSLGGYAEDKFLAEDYDFWLRASALFKLSPVHEDLYLYREHNESLTSLQGGLAHFTACETLKHNLPLLQWMDDSTRSRGYLRVAMAEQARGNMPEMRKCILRALYYSPAVIIKPLTIGLIMHGLMGQKIFRSFQRAFWAIQKLVNPPTRNRP